MSPRWIQSGVLVLFLFAAGCALGPSGPGADLMRQGRYDEAVSALETALASKPGDARLLRNLGVSRLKSGDAQGAVADLSESHRQDPGNAATLFFLGNAYETAGRDVDASKAYQSYLERQSGDGEVRARLRDVNLRIIRAELKAAVATEQRISAADIPENTLAVMEFSVLSENATLSPLSKGLSTMLSGDLSQVRRFSVVERQRLPILMNEMKLGVETVDVKPKEAAASLESVRGQKERLALMPSSGGGAYYSGPIDDVAEAAFDQAVRDFQRDAGIAVDGKIGPVTRSRLGEAYRRWLAEATIKIPAVDQTSAPRLGKLLGARLLVQGGISGDGVNSLRIDAGVTECTTGEARGGGAESGGLLSDLFRMEKEIVFGILDQLGVTPTDDERDAIGRLPTQNISAFLAWSEGLVLEDNGRFDLARQAYGRALEIDPGFQLARDYLQAISGSPDGFAGVENGLIEEALAGGGADGDVRDQLDHIGGVVGRGLAPGRSGDDQLDPAVTPVGAAGGSATIIVTGEVPR